MKPSEKHAAALLIVKRAADRKRKRDAAKVTRHLVKSLRTIADMVESGEVGEWAVTSNFGYRPIWYDDCGQERMVATGADELKINLRYSLVKFAKRMRRRRSQ